jgi:hypothetical protein
LPASVALRLVRATVIFWFAVHALTFLLGFRDLTPATHAAVIGIVMVLAYLDLRATNERLLYADLGIGPAHVFGTVLTVAVLLEVAASYALAGLVWPGTTEPIL